MICKILLSAFFKRYETGSDANKFNIVFRVYGGPAYKPVYWIEWCLASIFALNALYHIIRYIWATLSLKPIALSPKQRPLLGITEDDPLFKTEVPQKQKTPEPSPSLNLSCINLSRRTTPLGSSVLSEISMQNII